MEDLKRHLQDLKVMLAEEIKSREKLGRERTTMLSELASLETAIALGREKHAALVCSLEAERELKRAELGRHLSKLHAETKDLQVALGSWAVSSAMNDRLRQQVYQARHAAETEAKGFQEEERRVTEATSTMTGDLEDLTRRRLRDLDVEYGTRAYNDLRNDADAARRRNPHVSGRLEAKGVDAMKALDKQTHRAHHLRDARVEHDLLVEAKNSRDSRLACIKQSLDRADAKASHRQDRVAQKHAALRKARHDNASLRDGLKRIDDHARRLDDVNATLLRRRAKALKLASDVAANMDDSTTQAPRVAFATNGSDDDTVTCAYVARAGAPTREEKPKSGASPANTNHSGLRSNDDSRARSTTKARVPLRTKDTNAPWLLGTSASAPQLDRGPEDISEMEVLRMWNSRYADHA